MNAKFDNFRVIVNRNDLDSSNLVDKISVTNYSLTSLALEEIYQIYPEYKGFSATNSQKYEDYYVINLGPSVQISFTFKTFKFLINKPFLVPLSAPVVGNNQVILGGYQAFTNYTDTRFINCIQYSAKTFPELIGAQVTKVQYQIVAGINFLINLKKAVPSTTLFDQYEIRIYNSLDNNI